jgi:transposase
VTKGTIALSHRELDRLSVVQSVAARELTQHQAALRLDVSVRQIKRLVRRYRSQGAAGLASRHRGKRANNAISDSTRQWAIALVRAHYPDFGPTFAHERLVEAHSATFSVETLRQWMLADGLWQARGARQARIHPSRPRRPAVGELVQIDGSPHDWLEGRGPRATLIVFIDDATGRLLALRFVVTETTEAYMATLRTYLDHHGRPVALYSDQHSIFRINAAECEGALTQFTRALHTLDIKPIHAHTPQAKGRVERANQTLQDRLVKELRLAGIDDIDTANAFLPAFVERYNARFAKTPQQPDNAHRSVRHSAAELDLILTCQYTRKLSKNLTCQFQGHQYQVTDQGQGYRLRGAEISVCAAFDGRVTLLRHGQVLAHRLVGEHEVPIPVDDEKTVGDRVSQAKAEQQVRQTNKPPANHPWRKSYKHTPSTTA